LDKIREDEDTTVREFGLGLNRAMSKHRIVSDITAFERQQGLHLSIGAKHAIYPKPGFHRKHGRYHVDIFVDVERIVIDGEAVYQEGRFVVGG
jgi:leucyl aminopeptidase (aminopeptidase T)